MPGLGIGPGTTRLRRQPGRRPEVFITAAVVPVSSVLVAGQALRDTANWAAFTARSNYSTSAGGQTIASVVVNYIGDTLDANDPLAEGDLNHFSVTVIDTGGMPRTFSVQPRAVVSAAPVALTLAAVSQTQGSGPVTINLAAGFTGQGLTYTVDQPWATVSGSTLTIADAVRTGTVRITATNSGGSAFVDLSVSIAVPVVAVTNAIVDQSFALNSGDRTFDLRTVFSNATSYSVGGAGATIDVNGHTLRLDDGAPRGAVAITVTGSNGFNSAQDVFTLTVSAASAAPAQMAVPSLAVNGPTQITVTLAADPPNGGAAITSRDLRHSTDQATWTTFTSVTSPRAITALVSGTLHYVQARAVNSMGAGAWSASAFATTDVLQIPSILGFTVGTQSGAEIPVTIDLSDSAAMPYRVHVVAVPAGATAPNAAQVAAGNNAAGSAAPISATYSTSADGTTNVRMQATTTGSYDFHATVIDNNGTAWGQVASDLAVALAFSAPGTVQSVLGSKLYALMGLDDPSTLFTDSIGGTNVAATGNSVAFLEDQSGNGRHMRWHLASSGVTWDAGNQQSNFGSSAILKFINPPVGLTDTMEVYFALKTTDTKFLLLSRALVGNNFAFIADNTSTSGVTSGAGSPTYYVNNVVLNSPNRTTFQAAVATGSGLVVGASGLALANISTDGANIFISSSQSLGAGFRFEGVMTKIVFAKEALTSQERADLYAVLAGSLPV